MQWCILLLIITVPLTSAVCQSKARDIKGQQHVKLTTADNLTYSVIISDSGTFGYDIFKDGMLLIHQLHIPGRPGNNGFKTRHEAARVARFVITKIKRGIFPPTITIEELEQLKIKVE